MGMVPVLPAIGVHPMTRLKPQSERRRKRNAEAEPIREALRQEIRRCEICLKPREPHLLACHEIGRARGVNRAKCLDKRCCLLLVCREPDFRTQRDCHRESHQESELRQLARLYVVRSEDYDLTEYLRLTNPRAPNRITQDEVDLEIRGLLVHRGYVK
jgi:hypothetical protein